MSIRRNFFDRDNHGILIDSLWKRIDEAGIIRLIRAYLNNGIMSGGAVLERYQGTPRGGPLSSLLANVMLDEADKVLEKHGHCFARYAGDCNVYVRSRKAGERVMALRLRHWRRGSAIYRSFATRALPTAWRGEWPRTPAAGGGAAMATSNG